MCGLNLNAPLPEVKQIKVLKSYIHGLYKFTCINVNTTIQKDENFGSV